MAVIFETLKKNRWSISDGWTLCLLTKYYDFLWGYCFLAENKSTYFYISYYPMSLQFFQTLQLRSHQPDNIFCYVTIMMGSDMLLNFSNIFKHFLTLRATIKWIFGLRILETIFIFFFNTDMRDRIDCSWIWCNWP